MNRSTSTLRAGLVHSLCVVRDRTLDNWPPFWVAATAGCPQAVGCRDAASPPRHREGRQPSPLQLTCCFCWFCHTCEGLKKIKPSHFLIGFFNKAVKGNQLKTKSAQLQADSCHCERGPNQTTESPCAGTRAFDLICFSKATWDMSIQVRSCVLFYTYFPTSAPQQLWARPSSGFV